MALLALVFVLAAFLIGVAVTVRFVPRLAPTPTGRAVFWIVANLVGAFAALVVDELWIAIRALTVVSAQASSLGLGTVSVGGLSFKEVVVVGAAQAVLLEGGAMLALASIVYLLGPRDGRQH